MAKFEKLPIAHESVTPEGIQIISTKKTAAKPTAEKMTIVEPKRAQKYADILKAALTEPPVADTTFPRQLVHAEMEKNKNSPAPPNWDEIEVGRKKFVEALFKKKDS
jgi:hypothetical protein